VSFGRLSGDDGHSPHGKVCSTGHLGVFAFAVEQQKIQTVPKPIAKRDVAQRRTWLLIAAGQMKEMLLECI